MNKDKQSALAGMFANKSNGVPARFSLENTNRLVTRCAWVSWWVQIVLSVISGVILTFANTVRRGSSFSFWSSGFALSSIGVVLSFVNCIWTWNITRLTRRITFKSIEKVKVVPTLRNYFRIGIFLSLIGMFISLLGAEQIVGVLASKVLNAQGFGSTLVTNINSQNSLQALDIFLVQANTNVLVAHFAPLVLFLFAQTQVPSSVQVEILAEKTLADEGAASSSNPTPTPETEPPK